MRKAFYSNLAIFAAILTQEGETTKFEAFRYECVIVQGEARGCKASANNLQ